MDNYSHKKYSQKDSYKYKYNEYKESFKEYEYKVDYKRNA